MTRNLTTHSLDGITGHRRVIVDSKGETVAVYHMNSNEGRLAWVAIISTYVADGNVSLTDSDSGSIYVKPASQRATATH